MRVHRRVTTRLVPQARLRFRWLLAGVLVASATSCAGSIQPRVEMLERRPDQWSATIAGQLVITYCDPSLREEVERLFVHLRELSRQGVSIEAGTHFPYRWTTLQIREGPGRLEIWEPDYEHDPENRARPGVSSTLSVIREQRLVLGLAGIEGVDVRFDQHVLVAMDSWSRRDLMLARVDSPGGRMTGWRVVPSNIEDGVGEVESTPLYEIYRRRPALLAAMRLPPGYLVFFDGAEVVGIVNPNDELVWASPASSPAASPEESPPTANAGSLNRGSAPALRSIEPAR